MALASEYLAEGWTQDALKLTRRGKVKFCLLGAFIESIGRDRLREVGDAYLKIAGKEVSILNWNNAPNRTQAEVVALAQKMEFIMDLI